MEEIDFDADDFADIMVKDKRFNARAYAFLLNVVHFLSGDEGRHVSGEDILDEFKESALDYFGPLAYTVLMEWGVTSTEDLGEMMLNLVESQRVHRDDADSIETFAGGYDFKEAFLDPYQT